MRQEDRLGKVTSYLEQQRNMLEADRRSIVAELRILTEDVSSKGGSLTTACVRASPRIGSDRHSHRRDLTWDSVADHRHRCGPQASCHRSSAKASVIQSGP